MSFLEIKHPKFDERAKQIEYARDHYECSVLDNKPAYIFRYRQGENAHEHDARLEISDYTPHFTFAVNSTAGQIFPLEGEAERSWGRVRKEGEAEVIDGMGDPKDEDSVMYRIWSNIDGKGTNYPTLWRQLAPKLVYANIWGVLVEGPDVDNPEGRVVLVSPLNVPDWADDGSWVKITHEDYTRSDWKEEAVKRDLSTIYHLDGWERFVKDENDNETLIESGTYKYFVDGTKRKRTLPFRFVEVPLDVQVGTIMARKANAIFNQESARDWSMFRARFAMLAIDPDTPHTNEEIDKMLKEGPRWMKAGSLSFASPSIEGVSAGTDVLNQKVGDFYRTFYRSYEDAARLKTATEVIQDNRSGAESYLGMLKTALDEAENHVLGILEQIYFPNRPELWGGAYVERSDNFQPMNAQEVADRLLEKWIKDRTPIGKKGILNAIKKAAEVDGVTFDEDELNAEVDEWLANPPENPVSDAGGDGALGPVRMTARQANRAQRLREDVERPFRQMIDNMTTE